MGASGLFTTLEITLCFTSGLIKRAEQNAKKKKINLKGTICQEDHCQIHNNLSALYVCVTKLSSKYVLLNVLSSAQYSYSFNTTPPSRLAQIIVFPAKRKPVTQFSSDLSWSKTMNPLSFSLSGFHPILTLILFFNCLKTFENSALALQMRAKTSSEMKFYYTKGLPPKENFG